MTSQGVHLGVVLKNRYELVATLAGVRPGAAYDAIDRHLSKAVIARMFAAQPDGTWHGALVRGIEALARISHPGVIKPLDWGDTSDGSMFVVLERPEGTSLRELIPAEGLPTGRAASIARKVSQALTAAHDRGVVHAGLTPASIIVRDFEDGEETVKLIDFDLGAPQVEAGRLDPDAAVYRAHETVESGVATARSDIFALGTIVYEMVTGQKAFAIDSDWNLREAQRAGVRVRPRDLRPSLPEPAERVILGALAFNPLDRPARATAFGDDFHRSVLSAGRADSPQDAPTMEIAHVIVIKTEGPAVQRQPELRLRFDRAIRGTRAYQQAHARGELMEMRTAEGVVLAFFRGRPSAFVDAAIEIAEAFAALNEVKVRMGLHNGPVYRVEHTIAGPACSLAEHIAGCGEAGHVLVSHATADLLGQLGQAGDLHAAGEKTFDGGGDPVRIFNLYNDRVGNRASIRSARRRRPRAGPRPARAAGEAAARPLPAETPVLAPAVARALPAIPPSTGVIPTQVLAVSHSRDDRREGLLYAPGLTDDRVFVPINMERMQQDIERVRERAKVLTALALASAGRRELGIEDVAGELASRALPSQGLGDLVGAHPQLDLLPDPASRIPWEAFEEIYYRCAQCGSRESARSRDLSRRQHCQSCGEEMTLGGGKLVLSKHLTYVVRGETRPPGTGDRFLFIEDPTEDLLRTDRGGVCAAHLEELHGIVERLGFTVDILAGPNARVDAVRRKLGAADLAGIYYFGHGRHPVGGDEGFLVLRDGRLFAGQIVEAAPLHRFAFINACEAAEAGAEWDLSRKARSVAEALARGGRRVVVAPYWPVVNSQAAQMALWFFRSVLMPQLPAASVDAEPGAFEGREPDAMAPLAEALRIARELSHARYKAGEPHLGWMLYRYFGDPNATFRAIQPAATVPVQPSRLWRADGGLDEETFSFAIGDVLAAAMRAKESAGRTEIGVAELIAALAARGDLMRLLLADLGVDPDGLARGAIGGSDLAGLAATVHKTDFNPAVVDLLERSALLALERSVPADQRVSEHLLVAALTGREEWRQSAAPTPAEARRWLDARGARGVDANGVVSLERLDPAARRIVESSHAFAQQRGLFPIPNRLMLAAFLTESTAFACAACRSEGVDPELLFAVMIALSEREEDSSPRSFGLSAEACGRIVLPVIDEACRLAGPRQDVGEEQMFRAFCEKADQGFKAMLAEPPLGIDLDALKTFTPLLTELTPEARTVIGRAHVLAQAHGQRQIPHRLLLAAFLEDANGAAAASARQNGLDPAALHNQLLSSLPAVEPGVFPLDEAALQRAVKPAIELARATRMDGALVDAAALFAALCTTMPDELKGLVASGIDRVLQDAERLARRQGSPEVRTPHVFVAMMAHGVGPWRSILRESQLSPQSLADAVLSTIEPRAALDASSPVTLGPNVKRVLERMQRAAAAQHRAPTVDDLHAAFFADGGGVVGAVLAAIDMPLPNAGSRADVRGATALDAFGVDLTEKARRGGVPDIVGRDAEIETALGTLLLSENANPLLVGEAGVGKTAIVEGLAARIALGRCPKKLRGLRVIELSAGGLLANTRHRGEFEQRIQRVLAEARGQVILFIDEIHTIVGAGLGEGGGPDAANMLKAALARGELRLIGATTLAEYKRTIERDRALTRRFQVQIIQPPSREATVRILTARKGALEQHHQVTIAEDAVQAAVDLSGRYVVDRQWPAKARDSLERACVDATIHDHQTVGAGHVASVIAHQTGVPIEQVTASELDALADLDARIGQRILGQPEAIRALCTVVRKGRLGLTGPDRPWGVFLFVGPPGVGKTELAKTLATEVHGGPDALIRFDMGEFTEPHSVAKLTGAPPGYLGYLEGAPLVERLRRRPYSVVLFDEIEHANETVLKVLLRLLSDGVVTDADGHIADARNSMIIMTSNVLDAHDGTRIGFGGRSGSAVLPAQADLRSLLDERLPRALIDRIDAVIRFKPFAERDLADIAEQRLRQQVARVTGQHPAVRIAVDPSVAGWLAARALKEGTGARPLLRLIEDCVVPAIDRALTSIEGSSPVSLALGVHPDDGGIVCAVSRDASSSRP